MVPARAAPVVACEARRTVEKCPLLARKHYRVTDIVDSERLLGSMIVITMAMMVMVMVTMEISSNRARTLLHCTIGDMAVKP